LFFTGRTQKLEKLLAGLHVAGLHDHFNGGRLSIESLFHPIKAN